MLKDLKNNLPSNRHHTSIMVDEIVHYAQIAHKNCTNTHQRPFCLLDGTLGDAGHSLQLLKVFPKLQIIGCDRDIEMIARAKQRLQIQNLTLQTLSLPSENQMQSMLDTVLNKHTAQISIFHSDYAQLLKVFKKSNASFSLILFDLGVASYHFDSANRGFSFLDETLDMRLDKKENCQTAADWINSCSQQELTNVLFNHGEARFARLIATHLIAQRPFQSSRQLADQIACIVRSKIKQYTKRHPATKALQAIRIHINSEIEQLRQSLVYAPQLLTPNGILIYIAFHSIEDRLIKQQFQSLANSNLYVKLTKKPLTPSSFELTNNPRARSACMRVLQRVS